MQRYCLTSQENRHQVYDFILWYKTIIALVLVFHKMVGKGDTNSMTPCKRNPVAPRIGKALISPNMEMRCQDETTGETGQKNE